MKISYLTAAALSLAAQPAFAQEEASPATDSADGIIVECPNNITILECADTVSSIAQRSGTMVLAFQETAQRRAYMFAVGEMLIPLTDSDAKYYGLDDLPSEHTSQPAPAPQSAPAHWKDSYALAR